MYNSVTHTSLSTKRAELEITCVVITLFWHMQRLTECTEMSSNGFKMVRNGI